MSMIPELQIPYQSLQSPVQAELDWMTSQPQYRQMSPTEQLEALTDYENKLYDMREADYEGGWEQYVKDGPKSVQYLEDMKKDRFQAAQDEITEKYDKSLLWHGYNGMKEFLTLEGTAPPLEALMVRLGQGIYKVPALVAEAGGFTEAARTLQAKSDMVRKDYKVFADWAASAASGNPATDLLYNFASGFLSFLEPEDKEVLREIAKNNGLLNEDGSINEKAWYSPDVLAGAMGHFARHMVVFKSMFPGAKEYGKTAYAAAYGIAAAVQNALGVKSNEAMLPRMGKVAFWTSMALRSGSALSSWVGRNPLFMSFLSKIPPKAHEFILSRVSDVGESLADATMLSFQPGQNRWDIIKNFPVALAANMLEEVLVDFQGGRVAKGPLVQHQLHDLRMMETAEKGVRQQLLADIQKISTSKMDKASKAKAIAKKTKSLEKVDSVIEKIQGAYANRLKSLRGAFKENDAQVKEAIANNQQLYDTMLETNKQRGLTQAEAVEESTADLMALQVERGLKREAVDVTGTQERIEAMMTETAQKTVDTVSGDRIIAEFEEIKHVEDLSEEEILASFGEEVHEEEPVRTSETGGKKYIYTEGKWINTATGAAARSEKVIAAIEDNATIDTELYAAEEHSQLTGGAHKTLTDWYHRQPQEVQDVLTFNEVGDILVDKAKYEETHGQAYGGKPVPGRFVRINGTGLIEVAYGATPITAYHEIFHFAQKFTLTDAELKILADNVGSLEKQAQAFADYIVDSPTEGRIAKLFAKVKGFFNSVRNAFTGNGFTNVEAIYNKAFLGSGLVKRTQQAAELSQQMPATRVFLTPEGEKRVAGPYAADFPDAATEGWVKVNAKNGVSYAYSGDLTDEAIDMIDDDLQRRMPSDNVLIQTATEQIIIPKYTGSLREDLQGAWRQPMEANIDEMYAYEDEAERIQEVIVNETKPSKIWALLKPGGKIHEMLPFFRKKWKHTRGPQVDMSKIERIFDLPAFLGNKYPQVQAMIDAEDARKRLSVSLLGDFAHALKEYDSLDPDQLVIVDKLLFQGDSMERSFDIEELQGLGLTTEAQAAYISMRRTMAAVRADIIARIHAEYAKQQAKLDSLKDEMSPAVLERLEKSLATLKAELKRVGEWTGKGYMPHMWFGDRHVIVNIGRDMSKDFERIIEALDRIDESRGKNKELSKQFKWQFGLGEAVHMRIPFMENQNKEHDKAIDELKAIGIAVESENTGKDNNAFERATRSELVGLMDRIFDAAVTRENDDDILAAIGVIEKEYEIMEKTQGWRTHWLSRADTIGYEMMNTRAVVAQYLQGYAGMVGKAEASRKFLEIEDSAPPNTEMRKFLGDLRQQMLHQADQVDTIINHATSFLYAKHLGFNMVYHIRNRMQPLYFGIPVMMQHGIETKQATKEILKAQRDIFLLEKTLTKKVAAFEGEIIANEIYNISEEEVAAIIEYIADGDVGGIRADVFDKSLADEPHRRGMNILRKSYDTYLRASAKFITASDAKNRLQVFLASYRSLRSDTEQTTFDSEAYAKAKVISEEANVNYAGWNVPSLFMAGSKARIAKPLFMFHKYGWHVTRMQMRWVAQGDWGPMGAMYLITAALGGAGTLPFWEELKKILGIQKQVDLRKEFVDYMGGPGVLVDMLEHGVLGLAGIDISRSLQIRPIAFVDPLMGENALMSFYREFKNTKDDVLRGRMGKAMMEGAVSPTWVKRIARAYRQATEGVTSFRGDPTLDIDGKPIRLTPSELAYSALGFMPIRLAKHYSSQAALKELMSYYGLQKSRIATKFKIAQLKGDTSGMSSARRDAARFNRDVREVEASSGMAPSPPITADTLQNWGKYNANKRLAALSRYYYGDK